MRDELRWPSLAEQIEYWQRLKEDAMRAEELFGVDECERFSEQLRKQKKEHPFS